jgi:hypothetical protein
MGSPDSTAKPCRNRSMTRTPSDSKPPIAPHVTKHVSVSVDGPRRSEVFVDGQLIPMTGSFAREGDGDAELAPPDVDVDIVLKGQIGTDVTFTIAINDRKKQEQFVTAQEKEIKSFTYPFSAFGL